jgi:hypothetical protein
MTDEELQSVEHKESRELLENMFEKVSLKNVPLEDRRKEAKKPLYLVRYE